MVIKNTLYNRIILGVIILSAALAVSTERKEKSFATKEGSQFVLPDLPYGYSSLEPYIDTKTMKLHHDKHHRAYVDNLNSALKEYPQFQKLSVEELATNWKDLPDAIRTEVRNNAGGHLNHSLFWHWLTPKRAGHKIPKDLRRDISKTFGSMNKFKDEFIKAAKKVFGSGWAWLSFDKDNKLVITTTPNQDNPITDGLKPILGLDVWEHAYYLRYNNRRPDYLEALWKVINWAEVNSLYNQYKVATAK
jgi:superoxide dismutase, Fe-Mn family